MTPALRLFFDLDGTLTDSAEGITACIQYALSRLDRRQPSADEIRPFIGSPLSAIFESFLAEANAQAEDSASSDLVERAIDFYRERFDRKGFSENRLYPGIREALESLRADGHTLYIATAKRPDDALRVARHFEFDGLFDEVFGAQNDEERSDKAKLLARALESSGASPAASIMVGDRCHDISAAAHTGATPLGVDWGYGSDQELRDAGALHIVSTPAEMVEWIGRQTRKLAPSSPQPPSPQPPQSR